MRGGYDRTELSNVYTLSGAAAQRRADHVIQSLVRYAADMDEVKALGFCVSVQHAHFMADHFNAAGIPAMALDSHSSDEERRTARDKLISGDVRVIFAVDLYNEGVDIPEVNTVLFLRPTESLTIFLQQLGRGLRLSEGKGLPDGAGTSSALPTGVTISRRSLPRCWAMTTTASRKKSSAALPAHPRAATFSWKRRLPTRSWRTSAAASGATANWGQSHPLLRGRQRKGTDLLTLPGLVSSDARRYLQQGRHLCPPVRGSRCAEGLHGRDRSDSQQGALSLFGL